MGRRTKFFLFFSWLFSSFFFLFRVLGEEINEIGQLIVIPTKKVELTCPRRFSLAGTFNKIMRTEGFRGLYRGLGPTIFGYLPTWAIYFTVYDKVKLKMGKLRGTPAVFLFFFLSPEERASEDEERRKEGKNFYNGTR